MNLQELFFQIVEKQRRTFFYGMENYEQTRYKVSSFQKSQGYILHVLIFHFHYHSELV